MDLGCHTWLCTGWSLYLWLFLVALSRGFLGSPMRRSTNKWRRKAGPRPGEFFLGWFQRKPLLLTTRVDKPEECDREKCPKMMDICPEGGHCYGQFGLISMAIGIGHPSSIIYVMLAVTGDCGDDGCLCNIKIQCKETNKKEAENQVCPDQI